LSGGYDNTCILWSLKTFKMIFRFQGHSDAINEVCFGQEVFFSASDDKTIRVWNIEKQQFNAVLKGHLSRVNCIVYNEAKSILCSGSDDRTIRCWNIKTMNCEAIISDFAFPIYDLDYSSAQNLLVSCDDEGAVWLQSTKNL
jgi:WD40 repeat protein